MSQASLDLSPARAAGSSRRYPRSRVVVDEGRMYVFTQTKPDPPVLAFSADVAAVHTRGPRAATIALASGESWDVRKLCGCSSSPLPAFDWHELVAAASEDVPA